MADLDETVRLLVNGADDVVSEELLRAKLQKSQQASRPLIVKLGVDPTAPDIHLGHTVVLEKLRQFQDLGHSVVLLIGDMTGRIGDPSGRSAARKQLSQDDVEGFAKTYTDQSLKILNPDRLTLRYNSEWLAKINLTGLVQLMSQMTLARMLERDDFQQRYQGHLPIHLHELLYPLMQAYDSVALQADVELGGTDQRFNIMTARQIQEAYGLEPEVGLFMPLLEGTDGVKKMSKSVGNYVGIDESPTEMYGKIMSIPDSLLVRWSQLLLGDQPAEVTRRLQSGINPREVKVALASRIVARFWGDAKAQQAGEDFDRTFRHGEVPDDAPRIRVADAPSDMTALALLALVPDIESGQQARRLLQQGAVSYNGKRLQLTDMVQVESGAWLKVGKRRFYRFE